jgi:hypothetical protein
VEASARIRLAAAEAAALEVEATLRSRQGYEPPPVSLYALGRNELLEARAEKERYAQELIEEMVQEESLGPDVVPALRAELAPHLPVLARLHTASPTDPHFNREHFLWQQWIQFNVIHSQDHEAELAFLNWVYNELHFPLVNGESVLVTMLLMEAFPEWKHPSVYDTAVAMLLLRASRTEPSPLEKLTAAVESAREAGRLASQRRVDVFLAGLDSSSEPSTSPQRIPSSPEEEKDPWDFPIPSSVSSSPLSD